MITVIDYGSGNLRSVQKGLESIGSLVRISSSPQEIREADALILPGVGAFADCMQTLAKLKLIDPIKEAIYAGKPFLGICLGLQILFDESFEFGRTKGLGVIAGTVERFPENLKAPHMGWNTLDIKKPAPILEGLPPNPYFYFVHSYYVNPQDKSVIAATTNYGIDFVSMIWKDNIYAVQFHPEKSQELGLGVLRKFAQLCAKDAKEELKQRL